MNRPFYKLQSFCIFIAIFILLFSCNKDNIFTDDANATLTFSADTIYFDTVFTSIGSITLHFKVYNENDKAVKTSVALGGGQQSYFRLNIDGEPTDNYSDLEIMANDSAYIFAEVHIDPQNSNSPVIISDSIIFNTNGNNQYVNLFAYGQDVNIYKNAIIQTQTWTNDKPYLIYNSALVDSLHTLTIEAGTELYFHNNSSLLVKGTLIANGTTEDKILFQGDRLDNWYANAPGQWGKTKVNNNGDKEIFGGIHFFKGSQNNIINNAIIKNGNVGIQIEGGLETNNTSTLKLSNTLIYSMSIIGIEAQTSEITGYNNVIANCGYYCMRLMYGGKYQFYQSTFANYYPETYGIRKAETIMLNNYNYDKDAIKTYPLNAKFANCIIYGDDGRSSELLIDNNEQSATNFNYEFDHCLIKLNKEWDTSDANIYKDVITNTDSLPHFINPLLADFRIDSLSAGKNKGAVKYGTMYPMDINGNSRMEDNMPDLGAYEYKK